MTLGKIRINKNRGSGGHNGVQSIINELKTKNFIRFKIGIKPINKNQLTITGKIKNPEIFVLQEFSKDEKKILEKIIKQTIQAIEFFLIHGLEKTMTKYN